MPSTTTLQSHRNWNLLALALIGAALVALFLLSGQSGPAEAQEALPEMSLGAQGNVDCDGDTLADSKPDAVDRPAKCDAPFNPTDPSAGAFQITVNANVDFEISGFGSEVYLGGLTYNEGTCAEEVQLTGLCTRSVGSKGELQHGGSTGIVPPFSAANPGGVAMTLVKLDVNCAEQGSFQVGLTASGTTGSSFGATYFDVPAGNPVTVGVVGQQDFGNGPVDIADSLEINCVEELPLATRTPTSTLPVTATPTQMITPTGTMTPAATPVATAAPSPTLEPITSPTALVGDVNFDGSVNSLDAALILQLDAGLIESLPSQLTVRCLTSRRAMRYMNPVHL